MKKTLPPIVLLLAAFTGGWQPAFAKPHDEGQREEKPAARISLDQAVEMAQKRYNAKVVRTEVKERDGRTVYVLRLLNDAGRVWTVQVDAASGSMG